MERAAHSSRPSFITTWVYRLGIWPGYSHGASASFKRRFTPLAFMPQGIEPSMPKLGHRLRRAGYVRALLATGPQPLDHGHHAQQHTYAHDDGTKVRAGHNLQPKKHQQT